MRFHFTNWKLTEKHFSTKKLIGNYQIKKPMGVSKAPSDAHDAKHGKQSRYAMSIFCAKVFGFPRYSNNWKQLTRDASWIQKSGQMSARKRSQRTNEDWNGVQVEWRAQPLSLQRQREPVGN